MVGGDHITQEEKEALAARHIHHASPWVDLKILVQSLLIAAASEKLDRPAVADTMRWREELNAGRSGEFVPR